MTRPTVLIIPGWTNSGVDHWQSHWERSNPDYVRVAQRDWDHPDPAEWIAGLEDAVAKTDGRVVLVAHSLGCVAAARWIATAPERSRRKLVGAFLVAPSDVDRPDAPESLRPWRPMPQSRLPCPTLMIASRNDPYLPFERAQGLAAQWGSELVDAGDAGHINTASGYGPWPEGHRRLVEFIHGHRNRQGGFSER
jgi:predicted alpha/beta hydrolase family esterase